MPISVDRFTTHGLTRIYVDKQPIPASRIYHPNYLQRAKGDKCRDVIDIIIR